MKLRPICLKRGKDSLMRGVAFDIFFSIGEEANFGVGFAKGFFGIKGGHDGKLGEHDGGDFGVGADIHDGDGAVFGGNDGTEAGTFDPFDATELCEGIGHNTAGVASADEGICFPFFDEGHADGHGGLQATKFASGDFVCHFEKCRVRGRMIRWHGWDCVFEGEVGQPLRFRQELLRY